MNRTYEIVWRKRGEERVLLLRLLSLTSIPSLFILILDPPLYGQPSPKVSRLLKGAPRLLESSGDALALFVLGRAGPPMLIASGKDVGRWEEQMPAINQMLSSIPVFGRWWPPTEEAVRSCLKSFPRLTPRLRLLLAARPVMPYDWDRSPEILVDETARVVAEQIEGLPATMDTQKWDAFLDEMWTRAPVLDKGTPLRIRVTSADTFELPAEMPEWTVEIGQGETVLTHPKFILPQGMQAVALGETRDRTAKAVFLDGTSCAA